MIELNLPRQFLPIPADWMALRVMADYVTEEGNDGLAALLRWTANEWEARRWMGYEQCVPQAQAWARYKEQGWSPVWIRRVRRGVVEVQFCTRFSRVNGRQIGTRAWWDLRPRKSKRDRPAAHKGYSTTLNAALARALFGAAPRSMESRVPTIPRLPAISPLDLPTGRQRPWAARITPLPNQLALPFE